MLLNRQFCSWCHKLNYIQPHGPTVCEECGHRADVPRSECDCDQCIPLRRQPLDPADAAALFEKYDPE